MIMIMMCSLLAFGSLFKDSYIFLVMIQTCKVVRG